MKRAIFFIAIAACDQTHGVRASARVACDASQPIADVRVSFRCKNGQREIGRTDAQGRVEYGAIGYLDDECSIRFEKEGYVAREIAIRELCPSFVSGHCSFVFANAELARENEKKR